MGGQEQQSGNEKINKNVQNLQKFKWQTFRT